MDLNQYIFRIESNQRMDDEIRENALDLLSHTQREWEIISQFQKILADKPDYMRLKRLLVLLQVAWDLSVQGERGQQQTPEG